MPVGGSSGGDAASGGAQGGSLTISPEEVAHIGPQEDFDPASLQREYVLANETEDTQSWEVRVSEPWLSLAGPESGILEPGESIEVPVTVDPDIASQGESDPAVAQLIFLNSDTGAVLGMRGVSIETSFAGPGLIGGWTTFEPSVDTRMVYVSSSSGDDQNIGLSPEMPKQTLAAGQALLRHGYPDWLLLKRGDVWQESLGQWTKSGRASSEPMVVSTYGLSPDRPLLRTGSQTGIRTNGGGGSAATIDCLAIVGLHFQADGYTGGGDCYGAQMLQPGSHLLIEDCKFEGYGTNLVFQGFGGRHTDFRLRRSVIVDAYAVHSMSGAHAQGLYAYGVDQLLIEENVFDHNGWSETVPGAGADIYSHNMYIDNGNTAVRVRGNLIANGSSHGLQLRCGGSVVNNLFVKNSIALLVGGGNNPEPGGVTAAVRGNVILEGKNIDAANPRGWGIVLSNISSGEVSYNVVANNDLGTQPAPLILDGDAVGDSSPTVGVHHTRIVGNRFSNWGGGILVEGNPSQISHLEFSGNDVQDERLPWPLISHSVAGTTAAFRSSGNRFFDSISPITSWVEIGNVPRSIDHWKAQVGDTTSVIENAVYLEPDRCLADYSAFLGGAFGLSAFLDVSRLQSSTHWRPAYTAMRANRYIRLGF